MPMRVFIFEHIVGGGMLHGILRETLAAPAAAMLAAAVADFQRAGCEVVTTRDARIALATTASETFTLAPGEDVEAAFDRAATPADAALVIAPETGGALLAWTRRLERLGVRSLGATAAAVALCGDKLALADHLRAAGVPTPMTVCDVDALDDRSAPIVAKPRFGVGCESVRLLRGAREAAALSADAETGELIFQPWCAGRAVSVSLVADDERVRPIAAGEQFISGETALGYEGGRVPLHGTPAERATALAQQAAVGVEGLRGFVGVDLVLGARDDGRDDVVIEINPRLTLSYVALMPACEPTIAAALMDTTLEPVWAAQDVRLRFDHAGRVAAEQMDRWIK